MVVVATLRFRVRNMCSRAPRRSPRTHTRAGRVRLYVCGHQFGPPASRRETSGELLYIQIIHAYHDGNRVAILLERTVTKDTTHSADEIENGRLGQAARPGPRH